MSNYLPDTNLLVRSISPGDPQREIAIHAISTLIATGTLIHLVPQNLYEFWPVCTRTRENNGLGLTPIETTKEMARLHALMPVLQDNELILDRWTALVNKYSITGFQAHDARLVAAMLVHGITHLLTFNDRHFKRFTEITVVDPTTIQ